MYRDPRLERKLQYHSKLLKPEDFFNKEDCSTNSSPEYHQSCTKSLDVSPKIWPTTM